MSNPNEALCKLIDPRLGADYPIDSIRKVSKQNNRNCVYLFTKSLLLVIVILNFKKISNKNKFEESYVLILGNDVTCTKSKFIFYFIQQENVCIYFDTLIVISGGIVYNLKINK